MSATLARVRAYLAKSHTPWRIAFRRPWPGTRRGLKLWVISIVLGLKFLIYARGETSQATDEALRLVTEVWGWPLQVVGAAGVVACLIAAWCSYCHHGRDLWGYVLLTFCSVGWAAAFAASPVFLDGTTNAWNGALTYVFITILLLICAGDVEPRIRAASEDDLKVRLRDLVPTRLLRGRR